MDVGDHLRVVEALCEVDNVSSDLLNCGYELEQTELVFDNLRIKDKVTDIFGH